MHWISKADLQQAAYVSTAFDPEALKFICELPEEDFGEAFDMQRVDIDDPTQGESNFYFFKDNGARVLAVAHLDTVMGRDERVCQIVDTNAGPVVFSGALDDRLGAYVILDLLPNLDITYDWLLTVGEEEGRSTAAFFETTKDYDWIIEFDRGGTDVVLYQYEDPEVVALVEETGAEVAQGAFSDISYMEHLEVKAFNWGVGYQDYHGPRSHAFLNDTFLMVGYYLLFHEANVGTYMPHYQRPSVWGGRFSGIQSEADWVQYLRERYGADEDAGEEFEFAERESAWKDDGSTTTTLTEYQAANQAILSAIAED